MNILIINGPNLNLLGTREPGIYGSSSMEHILHEIKKQYSDIRLDYIQSNNEAEIINILHTTTADGIILNPGAYTHTSIAIGDAVAAINTPVVEVHISNVYTREEYRMRSFISPHAKGVITGFGLEGYRLGIEFFNSPIQLPG